MKKLIFCLFFTFWFSQENKAQNGYDIKINFKDCKDTIVYLIKYRFDQLNIIDTCKKLKKGQILFKGKNDLEKGQYMLLSQEKSFYFNFFINETQKFAINLENTEFINTFKSIGSKENEQFFSYIKFMAGKNKEVADYRTKLVGKNKEDSTKLITEKYRILNEDVKSFEKEFFLKNKGSFLSDVLNLNKEKEPAEIPKATNGRPDSIYQYYYYKNHFFDGVDFKDERMVNTEFFDDRIKKYFESVLLQHPDTIIQAIDKILDKCTQGNLVYSVLIGYFAYKYEQSKIMGFDKVFVHIADKYIINGKASGAYTAETVLKIKERVDIMRNLLLDSKVADLNMIDTTYAKQVMKMGFDTAKTSKSCTDLYYKNVEKLTPMFNSLYQVNAKYTVLVFWASDCGHCKTEIPKLKENLDKIKGQIDFKVFSVQTKEDVVEWQKFIIEQKLDFINVFDPIHLNNLKDRFDIYSTPVIYVLDKEKRIKAKRLSAEQVVDMLKMLESIEIANFKK